jgi:hypothetical protein
VTQASCLSVSGKVAVIGVSGVQTFLGFGMPVAGLIRVTDGGGPDSGEDSFEFATRAGDPQVPGPTDCSSFPTGGQTAVNTTGDLTVIDSSPLPTSRNQCRNGGWRNYGARFENQGQCVSFVAKGGKQVPLVSATSATGRDGVQSSVALEVSRRVPASGKL